jgi:hypothetical protein
LLRHPSLRLHCLVSIKTADRRRCLSEFLETLLVIPFPGGSDILGSDCPSDLESGFPAQFGDGKRTHIIALPFRLTVALREQ